MKKLLLGAFCALCFLVLYPSALLAQEKSIQGIVLASDTGDPIPIASVLVKGHNNLGAYTDDNCKFYGL